LNTARVMGLVLFPLTAGLAALVWLSRARRRRDARFHAGLARTIEMESDAFEDKDDMGSAFTCRGDGVSPPLRWNHLPHGTRSLALVVTDPDAPAPGLGLFTIVHWVLYNIPPGIDGLPTDASPADLHELGLAVGRNWSGDRAYAPPCPPLGRHRYVFRLYALDVDGIDPREDDRRGILEALEGHVLAYGTLTGTCSR